MAGTQLSGEGLPGFRVSTLRAAASSLVDSLEGGFQVDTLQNGAVAYVVDQVRSYRWNDTSLAAPSDPDIVVPIGQSLSIPGRWLIIPEGGGGGSGVVLTQVRYVDEHTASLAPDGSIANPFALISEAIASLTGDEIASPFGYVIYLAPGAYDTEDQIDVPGTVCTFQAYGGTFPKGARMRNVTSDTLTNLTFKDVAFNNISLDTCDVYLDNALCEGEMDFNTGGQVYSFGAATLYGDVTQGDITNATHVTVANGFQTLSNVTIQGILNVRDGVMNGDISAASLIAYDSDANSGPGVNEINISGDIDFNNGNLFKLVRHDVGTVRFVNTTFSGGELIHTNEVALYMFGCRFGAAPEVFFDGAAGILYLDSISNFFFTNEGGVVTNGVVTVVA